MGRQAARTVTMPELSGGLNLRDSVSMVRDNQLTDGLNVWYKDAVLKTRPGMQGLQTEYLFNDTADAAFEGIYVNSKPSDIQRTIGGKIYRLFTAHVGEGFDERILFRLVAEDAVQALPSISGPDHAYDLGIRNYFVFEDGQTLYCFLTAGEPEMEKQIGLRLNEVENQWEELTEADYYVPLVAINGNMNHVFSEPKKTLYEGYNLLSHRYRMMFDADTAEPSIMRYVTLRTLDGVRDKVLGQKVTAKLTNKDGVTVTHTVTLSEAVPSLEDTVGSDGLRMAVGQQSILFHDKNGADVAVPEMYRDLHNNFEFEIPFWDAAHEAARTGIFGMGESTWFGGASAGINGGTRLFLCGNTAEKEQNLVVWSDLNRPLYFPENNCFYVGNAAQAVTGFGKQNEILVIFKERELFYTYYQQGDNYSASDVISQNVIDVTAASAYFPLVQIHGSIGCDCPDSIQLCRNRLVWASTEGKVYTLTTTSQYSERNVYEVSGMVERRLKKEAMEDLAAAFSCDWQGLYCLFVKNHLYLMDYNSYGYQHAYSYSKTEDSNVLIPWWYWEFPAPDEGKPGIYGRWYCLYAVGKSITAGLIKMIETDTEESGTVRFYYEELYTVQPEFRQDECYRHDVSAMPVSKDDVPAVLPLRKAAIPSMAQTKIFDFGQPQKNKAIPLVNSSFGNNGGDPITIFYITENGEYTEETVKPRHKEISTYSAGYVRSYPFRPCVGMVACFGLRITCNGNMAVDSVSINYRPTGGAK